MKIGIFVMDEKETIGTYWHPNDLSSAIHDIVEFMEGKKKYIMQPSKGETA